MLVFLLGDIFYFKERLDCGSEKLKKFILFLVIGGVIWNFCADFDYRAARAYFKINRYFIIVFYIYSLVKYKKEIFDKFIITLLISYLFLQGVKFYFDYQPLGQKRFDSFENSYMGTSLIATIFGVVSFSQILSNKNKKINCFSYFY